MFFTFFFPFITLIKWRRFAALVIQALLKLHFHGANGFYTQNSEQTLGVARCCDDGEALTQLAFAPMASSGGFVKSP